jgi:hypothetical protein
MASEPYSAAAPSVSTSVLAMALVGMKLRSAEAAPA